MTSDISRIIDLRERKHFWFIVFNFVSMFGVFVALYQIKQTAEIQSESVANERRNQMAALALTAHRLAYQFMTTVMASDVKSTFTPDEFDQPASNGEAVTNEIRTSGFMLDAAVAEALMVDDLEVQACLMVLGTISGTMMDDALLQNKEFKAEPFTGALDKFSHIVKRYWDGGAPPASFATKTTDTVDLFDCPFHAELSEAMGNPSIDHPAADY